MNREMQIDPQMQDMLVGSPETKINWVRDVDQFENRLSTGRKNYAMNHFQLEQSRLPQ